MHHVEHRQAERPISPREIDEQKSRDQAHPHRNAFIAGEKFIGEPLPDRFADFIMHDNFGESAGSQHSHGEMKSRHAGLPKIMRVPPENRNAAIAPCETFRPVHENVGSTVAAVVWVRALMATPRMAPLSGRNAGELKL